MISKNGLVFASEVALPAGNIALAGEVWLADIVSSSWATSDLMKLANLITKTFEAGAFGAMSLAAIEGKSQLGREEVRRSLVLMQNYRFINSFFIERDELHIEVRMSILQALRVLETRHRLDELLESQADAEFAAAEQAQARDGEREPVSEQAEVELTEAPRAA